MLHIKDGPCVKGQPMTAVGDGVMDFPPIVKAGAGITEWMVVEIDSVAADRDMMEAVERSYKYLVGNKLAAGRK
jgi:sugar phosphate isomerase/epimerase